MTTHRDDVDSLTGLGNRRSFYRALEYALSSNRPVGVLLLDMVDTKALNDTYGHLVGDELLKAVARRLAGAVHEDDIVARIGGDEFAVIAHSVRGDADELALLVREVDDLCLEPYDAAGRSIHVGFHIRSGLAESSADLSDIDNELQTHRARQGVTRVDARSRHTELSCSFCGKKQDETRKLVAGPEVYICSDCVALCVEIIEEDRRA